MNLNYKKVPTTLNSEELLDKAFKRASKISASSERLRAITKITTASNVIQDYLDKIIKAHPSYERIPPFYRELIDILVGINKIRQALGSLAWAKSQISRLTKIYIRELKKTKDIQRVRKEAYGRISSVVHQINPHLEFLNHTRNQLKQLPALMDIPTVVVAGFPNVGKTSLVSMISTVHPKISSYPFTTTGIHVGFFEVGDQQCQIIDTPGLLDRPLEKRNPIERQAILCLKYVADIMVFILDPSTHCGYPLEDQLHLLQEVKREFPVPIIEVNAKSDLHSFHERLRISTHTGEGIDQLIEEIRKRLKSVQKDAQTETY
jgi:nucleolar GTP-binding protein